mmetsp:Transcript_5853/g.12180  ORF Transcript_5853/g.12180 Transcript_5853/m.12180 type:complete len:339 (+) Transcript_5853:324-1340(+)
MLPAKFDKNDPERTCSACFFQLQPLQKMFCEKRSNSARENELSDAARYFNSPTRFTLGGEVRKASYTVQNIIDGIGTHALGNDDKAITNDLVTNCKGLLFITVVKMAFLGGIRFGSGLVVVRTPGDDSWSAPCAVILGGITIGMQFGAQVVDMIIPLHDPAALAHFSVRGGKHVMFGSELAVAVGPLGRSAEATCMASQRSVDTAVSYSHSRGLYSGVTLDGAIVSVRDDVNRKFYGRDVEPAHLFDGTISRPTAAEPLYKTLANYEQTLGHLAPVSQTRQTKVDAHATPTKEATNKPPKKKIPAIEKRISSYEEFNPDSGHSDDEDDLQAKTEYFDV